MCCCKYCDVEVEVEVGPSASLRDDKVEVKFLCIRNEIRVDFLFEAEEKTAEVNK